MRKSLTLFFVIICVSLVNAAQTPKPELPSKFKTSGSNAARTQVQSSGPERFSGNQKNLLTTQSPSNRIEAGPTGDTYSLAPLVQDGELAYFMTDAGQATSHQYDESWKTMGKNQYGTSGGNFLVLEKTNDLGNGEVQITVQVTAVNAQNAEEPWVDTGFSGSGLETWRLDVGTSFGGSNPIEPDSPFEVTASGVSLYDSAGESLGDFDINDTSNSGGLSGGALIGLADDADIAGFDLSTMVMYWNIKIEPDVGGFPVTAGQSGAWYDPSHNGEGFFLQVLSETEAVVFWFSYDKNGNQFWMFGIGNIEGSKITFPALESPNGGKFGPGFDPQDVEYPVWGSLEFDFSTCNSATANYSGPPEFGTGVLNLTRLTTLWGFDCQGNDSNPPSTGNGFLSGGFSGSWFDISHNGEGFVVEVLNETTAVVIWFTYDTEGNPAWILGSGEIDGATIIVNEFQTTSGGVFGPGFNPDDVEYKLWGPAVYTFGSCGESSAAGNMRYVPPVGFGIESNQFLYRLVSISGLQCDFLTDTYSVQGTMNVAENIFLDGDVNDPNVPEVSNDLDAPNAQQLVPPAKVAGFVTAVPTEEEGDRFANEIDEWDVYVLAIRAGESISLNISDWDSTDKESIDLDLYLVNVKDPETVVDSSESVDQTEWVTAPEDGNYFVSINAYSGTSNYLLRSGQSAPPVAAKLSASAEMATGELIAALKPQNGIAFANHQNTYKSRIEKLEKENALSRIEVGENGEILYSVNTARIDHLVPHPLTLIGRGSISPEDWQVIKAAKVLSASGDYRWAGPNYIQHQMATPNDPGYAHQWHYSLIRLPQAWDTTTGSSDIIVAVVDSGVYDHPDLVSNVNYSLGYDFVSSTLNSGDGDGMDTDARDPGKLFPSLADYVSHGTHVAGTVGANSNNGTGVAGVNWDVTLMPVRVLGNDTQGSCWDITNGMKWSGRLANSSGTLPAKAADVINMSLGGTEACFGSQEIVDQLVAKNIVVIAAAGNENNSIPIYPASLANVISVSATTLTDELAPYSSYGSHVDVAAPGGDNEIDSNNDSNPDGVLSTVMLIEVGTSTLTNTYGFLPGTSMASPHISGIAALMKSVYPDMGPTEFYTAISSGQITLDLAQNGSTNKDPQFGYGRIDAQKAINWAVEQSQGSPGDAFLTSSISAANFGSNQQSIDFVISKGGEGAITVAGGEDTETWMQVLAVSTDDDGLGTYRISVDRSGLIDGSYSGWVGIDGSDGSKIWISVAMQVGDKVAGEAGYLYALLLDSWTYGNVKQWDGLAISGDYTITLDSNPPGTYFMMVGSDIDNDGTVCDPGEFCQAYPLNSQASEIIVAGSNVQLGNFTLGFPGDTDDGNVSSAMLGADPAEDPDTLEIMARIGTTGIARRR